MVVNNYDLVVLDSQCLFGIPSNHIRREVSLLSEVVNGKTTDGWENVCLSSQAVSFTERFIVYIADQIDC